MSLKFNYVEYWLIKNGWDSVLQFDCGFSKGSQNQKNDNNEAKIWKVIYSLFIKTEIFTQNQSITIHLHFPKFLGVLLWLPSTYNWTLCWHL